MIMGHMKPIYVRVKDSKIYFGIGRTTIYEMAARGDLHIHKSGSASLLKVEEVEALIEGKKEKDA
jgi:excisionase family DNA binding protein